MVEVWILLLLQHCFVVVDRSSFLTGLSLYFLLLKKGEEEAGRDVRRKFHANFSSKASAS